MNLLEDMNKRAYIHMSPVPVEVMGDLIEQMRKQGWVREKVLFAGMVQAAPAIALPGMSGAPVPVYTLLFSKQFLNGSQPVPPTLKQPGSTGDSRVAPFTLVKG